MKFDKDLLGFFVSLLCLIHCLGGHILLILGFTSAGLSIFGNEKLHLALVAPILLIAAWSLPRGLKSHRHSTPSKLAVLGIIFLILGLMIEEFELVLTVLASSLLMTAHLYNRKLLKEKKYVNSY